MEIYVVLGVLVICSLVLSVNGLKYPVCPAYPVRANGINPVTLGLNYCRNTELMKEKDASGTALLSVKLMNKEDVFKYKLTDVRSNLEYYFDSIQFANRERLNQKFDFMSPGVRILIVHQRMIPEEDDSRRYFIISQKVESDKSIKPKSKILLETLVNISSETVTLKPNMIFPGYGMADRYDGGEESKNCGVLVVIEFVEPLKVAESEFKKIEQYASQWNASSLKLGDNTTRLKFHENGTVRFDCQRPLNPNAGNIAAYVHFSAAFQILQFILAAILLKDI